MLLEVQLSDKNVNITLDDNAKKWIAEIPEGDCLVFRAEGAKADQLFRIYKKWFKTHENIPWVISEEHKSFFFYKV